MMNAENSYLFKFAWKSILRNKGRSFFIGFSVSLAVMIAIWVVAFFEGLNFQIEKAVVNTNTGYLQIQEPLFAETTDSSSLREFSSDLKTLTSHFPIMSASPELILDSNISTPEGAAGLIAIGIVPEIHKNFLPIKDKIIKGQFLTKDDEFQVVIGNELSELFKFNVGDQLILNYQDVDGALRSEILSIKGIFRYNSKGFEKRFIYLNQKTWQKLFLNRDTKKILFNRIPIMIPDLRFASEVEAKIRGTDLKIKSWKDLNPEMAVVLEFHDGMIKFFFLIIGVTILMTILTPVRMLWQERFKELRMMNTIGVSVKKFWKIGFFESFLMIILSGTFSTALLALLIGYQSSQGVDFRYLNDGIPIERAGIKLPGIIYPRLSGDEVLITFVFVIFVLGTSYMWSIYRTIKKLEAEL
jgi:ABC-type lipoprotein release transport system permease subunit